MNVQTNRNDTEQALHRQLEAYSPSAKSTPSVLADARRAAVEGLNSSGLPHRRVEAWKYTDLRNLMRTAFPLATRDSAAGVKIKAYKTVFDDLPGTKLVFVNGFLRDDLSDGNNLPDGVTLEPLTDAFASNPDLLLGTLPGQAKGSENAIGNLVSALADDGLVLRVAANRKIAEPVHLIHINEAGEAFAAYRHVLVVMGEASSLTLLENHQGSGAYQTGGVLGFDLEANAELDHVKLQGESKNAQHLSRIAIRLAGNTACRSFTLNLGAEVSRNEAHIEYAGPQSFAHVSGASLLRDKQHADTTIVVDHAVPDCSSAQTFKYVMNDNARGVFQGKVIVRPGAHGTDGRQSSNALLLS
ncbi:MAG: SufD family Fe-S cluster assembly protein, partial [Fimbriimonadaceae bacterium]|nr:SufD family Fe-S cluster assembly protein [Alphaproteobacteria bacterium]